jgi:hypothetical protein
MLPTTGDRPSKHSVWAEHVDTCHPDLTPRARFVHMSCMVPLLGLGLALAAICTIVLWLPVAATRTVAGALGRPANGPRLNDVVVWEERWMIRAIEHSLLRPLRLDCPRPPRPTRDSGAHLSFLVDTS